MTRRTWWMIGGIGVIVICGVVAARLLAPPPPPNIVVIMADDHAQRAISAYGSSLIQTPNIDRLADEGIIFSSSFVTNSICAPSRAVLLTGQYSHRNGLRDNRYRAAVVTRQPSVPRTVKVMGAGFRYSPSAVSNRAMSCSLSAGSRVA